MQLVGDGVEMLDAMKNQRIDRDGVVEKFGVGPERVVDVQALAGDSVDNVPGAPGIGIKTAALLINEYGDLETLLDARGRDQAAQAPRDPDRQAPTRSACPSSWCSWIDDTPLDFTLDDLELRDPEPETLLPFLAEMEFRTLTKRIADKLGVEAPVIADTPADAPTRRQRPNAVPFDPAAYELRARRRRAAGLDRPDPRARLGGGRHRNHRA